MVTLLEEITFGEGLLGEGVSRVVNHGTVRTNVFREITALRVKFELSDRSSQFAITGCFNVVALYAIAALGQFHGGG